MIYKKSWKYILIKEDSFLRTLTKISYYRPKAIKDFSDVRKGDIGGYIQHYYNLSQSGKCWVYNEAWVCENARVSENAVVCENAFVEGNAVVFGNAKVCGNALVKGTTIMNDNTVICRDTIIDNNIIITGKSLKNDDI